MRTRLTRGILVLAGALSLALPAGAQTQPASPATTGAPQLPPYMRQDLYPAFVDAAGKINWPPHDGFAADPVSTTLQPGTLIDRFGSEGGTFFSPKGESFDARALPYVCSQMAYTVYRVDKPVHVLEGKAAPWFNEPGGAEQYETDEPAYKLRASGAIEVVPNDSGGSGKPAAPCGGS